MDIKLQFHPNRAVIAEIGELLEKSLGETADALMTDVKNSQVMPFNTGTMQNESTFIKKGKFTGATKQYLLVTQTPYAARLYFHPEYNFRRNNNQNAGGKWLEPWISGNKKDFCLETFTELLRKEWGKF